MIYLTNILRHELHVVHLGQSLHQMVVIVVILVPPTVSITIITTQIINPTVQTIVSNDQRQLTRITKIHFLNRDHIQIIPTILIISFINNVDTQNVNLLHKHHHHHVVNPVPIVIPLILVHPQYGILLLLLHNNEYNRKHN